ncbi:MAG: MBL fold metallo-hydrolase [Acidimicrobiales bacterium]
MSALEITVLGSSGSYASPTNGCTGFLVRSAGADVVFDCGPGTLGPLQAACDLLEVSAVILSHCHPDHWLELPVLRNVFTWFVPRTDVPVFGTAETRRMDQALHVRVPGAPDPFRWTEIDSTSRVEIGDQRWTFDRTDHPVETLAGRVDVADRTVVFTSDSGPGWSYDHFAPDVDLVLCDASHLSTFEHFGIPHMSARQAGAKARSAGARRLVVTHLVPGSDPSAHRDEAEAAYGGPVDVALPGCVFAV